MRAGTISIILLFLSAVIESGRVRRRRRAAPVPPPCTAKNCIVSGWSLYSSCTHHCGNSGTQTRTRRVTRAQECGGTCPYHLSETIACNRDACRNGGTPANGYCRCRVGYRGTCCELDIDECATQRPCQHFCTNTYGSYTCKCKPCYTKLGTRCELRQCSIGGTCYPYGTVNQHNPCQVCSSANMFAWSHRDAPSCSDGVACTKNDRCVNQRCVGTPYTCLPCEKCHADTCVVKPGFCLIVVTGTKTCFTHKDLRPGYQCQECDSNNIYRWTVNNNLPCTDNNVKTKNDRCFNGTCLKGVPYPCLPCEHHDGFGCPLNPGYCIIEHEGQRTCFATKQFLPGNPCQWCDPSVSTSSWTSRDGVPCDDGNKCTAADTCTRGLCTSKPLTCNERCQFCNGYACGNKPGFGFRNRNCTCRIGGKDYSHQEINPVNQCQWCDIYDDIAKATGSWTNRPSMPCNDRNPCTKRDQCVMGKCEGVAYSCQSKQAFSSCILRSECVGDGTCRDVIRPAGTICRPPVDGCDRPEKCDGRLGTCPAAVTEQITVKTGSLHLMDSSFTKKTTFQSSTSNLFLQITNFTVSCGTLKYSWFLLKGDDACRIKSYLTKGVLLTTEKTQVLNNLTLVDSQIYKVAVEVTDERKERHPLVCSDFVTVDATVPQGGWVRDGSTGDAKYQFSRLITARWGGFTSRNGIAKYEWDILNRPFGSSTTMRLLTKDVGLQTTASQSWNGITDGSLVTSKVRAFTKAGLYTERISNGVIIDTSPPVKGRVYDGYGPGDSQYVKWTNTFTAHWDAFSDIHSEMSSYEWAIKRSEVFITSYKNTALRRNDTITGLNLANAETYCAVVRGYNKAGLKTEAGSNCVYVDQNPPRAGIVNDGAAGDVDNQASGSYIAANWDGFGDGAKGSGIREYMYKITDDAGNLIVDWMSVGTRTSMNQSGLVLQNGKTYHVTIRAQDAAGWHTDVTSDGVKVDTTKPVFTGTVAVSGIVGTTNGTTAVYITSTSVLEASWRGFAHGSSGLSYYQWAIIPASDKLKDSDLKRVTASGLPTSALFSNLTLVEGHAYKLVIRAHNHAFLYTDAYSDNIIPDPSPPEPGIVSDGATDDVSYQTWLDHVEATWTPFVEPHTRVKQYYFAIGSCSLGNYHVTGNRFLTVSPPTSNSVVFRGARLVNGQTYCTKVKAENMAGVFSKEVSSNGFLVDATPPAINQARVVDGLTGTDVDFQDSVSGMSAMWEGIEDIESKIAFYEVGLSTARNGDANIVTFQNVGLNTSVRVDILALRDGVYYAKVCAFNKAGLKACISSDGFIIDSTPPHKGVVNDGVIEPDLKYQSSKTMMSANWGGIWDLESGLEKFEWAIRENATNATVMDFKDAGLATHVTSDAINLENGKTYYVLLRATNKAGDVRELHSNGVTIDNTPPLPNPVHPGYRDSNGWVQSGGMFYSSNISHISAHWRPFVDEESEIWFYKWAVGTTRCGGQVQSFVNIGQETRANESAASLGLINGVKYYVTVTSMNRANQNSRSCSDAFVFDNTPPQMGNIIIGSVSRHQKFIKAAESLIRIYWDGVDDRESGLKYCSMFTEKGSEHRILATNITVESGFSSITKDAFNGSHYNRVAMQCVNTVGLSSIVWSDVFVIDSSPPVPRGEVLVGESRDAAHQYQSSTNSMTMSWSLFADDESPVTEYWVAIGTAPHMYDVLKYLSVGLVTQHVQRSLRLSHNMTYYVTVLAWNAVGLNASVTGLPVLIDKTPPHAPHDSVKIGNSGESLSYMTLGDTLQAHWEAIEDHESGVKSSRYCVGTVPHGCQITGPIDTANSRFSCPLCALEHGEKVFVTVTVTNNAVLSTTRWSKGVQIDDTPPSISDVIDGDDIKDDVIHKDLETALEKWHVTATWQGVEDRESGIVRCTWRLLDMNDNEVFSKTLKGPNILGRKVTLKSNMTYGSIPGNSSFYYNVIKCTNGAKLVSESKSNGFVVVSEWPTPAEVRDGPTFGSDLDYVTSTTHVSANWDNFQTNEKDPVAYYAWAVGSAAGLDDLLKFQSVGLVNSVETGLPAHKQMKAGRMYYVTVEATSISGLASRSSSDGFTVDDTSPVGADVTVSFTISDDDQGVVDLFLNWDGVRDEESGIFDSQYCVASTPGSCLFSSVSNGNLTASSFVSFMPASLQDYYVIVKISNNARLATVLLSDKFSFDTTPPTQGDVEDLIGSDAKTGSGIKTGSGVKITSNNTHVAARWGGFEDLESGVQNCTWSLVQQAPTANRSSFGNDTIVFQESVPAKGEATRGGLSLSPGSKCFSRVTCQNRDGFKVISDGKGVIVDVSPPAIGNVSDGKDVTNDLKIIAVNDTVHATWTAFKDPESGVIAYRWGLGTALGVDDVIALRSAGLEMAGSAKRVNLTTGVKYFVTVEAKNGAGLLSQAWSNGFIVDDTPPELRDLTLGPRLWIRPGETLSANWKSRDPESGVTRTEYCVGSTPAGCQISRMREILPTAMHVSCNDCNLQEFVSYYVTVRVWNSVGLWTSKTSSSVEVDLTPPIPGTITPSQAAIACISKCTLISTITPFIDHESGIKSCQFAIRDSNNRYITSFKNYLPGGVARAIDLTLVSGQRYYTVVSCVDNAGLVTEAVSEEGTLVDVTPPTKGHVIVSPDRTHDVYHIHSNCHLYNKTLRAYWSRFNDLESGITGFRIAIGTLPSNTTNIYPYTDVGISTSFEVLLDDKLGVSNGDIIYVSVEARNAAGLITTVTSPPTKLVSADVLDWWKEGDFSCLNF
ncbi:uncharacterized protein LOC5508728 isoform X2 [Nematostella vectensis]|uniref:uncharacterized protein LOC5508728 isoform X2 n=1 Tax=Nematostella vectensis TaxID=45351 RepID=UPI0020778FE6|nr:uncharacterized protein LOC5508728 isoform X2 [Nematostella vectensis]